MRRRVPSNFACEKNREGKPKNVRRKCFQGGGMAPTPFMCILLGIPVLPTIYYEVFYGRRRLKPKTYMDWTLI